MRVYLNVNGDEFTEFTEFKTRPSPDGLELRFKFGLSDVRYRIRFQVEELVIPLSFETRSVVGTWILVPSPGDDPGWSQYFSDSGHRSFEYYVLGRRLHLNPLGLETYYMSFLGVSWKVDAASLREAQCRALALAVEDLQNLASRTVTELTPPKDIPTSSRFDLIG